ncbi:hypothetical protein M9H77_08327 [Catharanthus roseus]|uniref:Uncharacterized protein n=1 Tax=Catharanthus roseus TaxID=4058 RepID=A0ACC0BXE1_CATRO|nr:hypothetical protein M9H77_08327 [Catharanthus roseus]
MEMEKSCEFCLLMRPIVYCKSDTAYLCLSCDAKVHSANALSSRHPRILVCEKCGQCPSFVQCSQHQMFLCRHCDRTQHVLSSQHQRKVISSFMGCPSAKDFAALWGIDLNEFHDYTFQDQDISPPNLTVDKGEGLSSVSEVTEAGSSRRKHPKISIATETDLKGNQREDISNILQQILDLKKLQQNQGTGPSLVRDQEETDMSSFRFSATWKLQDNLDHHLQHSLDLGSNLHRLGSPPWKSDTESFPFLSSQLDGDAFWQCRSPIQNGQLWPQNMQDLGVCDDRGCMDDFTMPEVDLKFENIEELFANEQELDSVLFHDNDTLCSSVEKDLSYDKSDNGCERSMEDMPAGSSSYTSHSANRGKDVDFPDNRNHFLNSKEPRCTIRPSYSLLSFSTMSAESSGHEYQDTEPSSSFVEQQHSCNSSDLDSAKLHSKENVISRHKEKKNLRRNEKQAHYSTRKARSDVRRMVKGQFAKTESFESNVVSFSRSF